METQLKDCIRDWYFGLKPYMENKLVTGRSCTPVKALIEELDNFGISCKYYDGAPTMMIEDKKIFIITGKMNIQYGSVFIVPDENVGYVPYSMLIKLLATVMGAGRKTAPFVDPQAVHQYLLEWYWGELGKILEETS